MCNSVICWSALDYNNKERRLKCNDCMFITKLIKRDMWVQNVKLAKLLGIHKIQPMDHNVNQLKWVHISNPIFKDPL